MKPSLERLEQIFYDQRPLSEEILFAMFDEAGIPEETGWRTVYRMIFDIRFRSTLKRRLPETRLTPIMQKALKNAEKYDFSEQALLTLVGDYNSANLAVCYGELTGVLDELDLLAGEFRSMNQHRQKSIETLSSETISTVKSDLTIEEKVTLIKSKFKKTMDMFQEDLAVLDQMSHTDHLTGLYNRRFFDAQIRKEVGQALKEKTWLNLLIMDIDDFKQFNDTYGHQVGDQALKTIAKNIRDCCENETAKTGIYFYPARYGGEEFAIILPAIDQKASLRIAECMRERIADYTFVIRNKKGHIRHKDLSLTVSIGSARLDHLLDEKTGGNDLIKTADQAMYDAKKSGKNCVRSSAN